MCAAISDGYALIAGWPVTASPDLDSASIAGRQGAEASESMGQLAKLSQPLATLVQCA